MGSVVEFLVTEIYHYIENDILLTEIMEDSISHNMIGTNSLSL